MINHNPEEDILEDSEELIEADSERKQLEKEHFTSTYSLKPNENYDAKYNEGSIYTIHRRKK